MAELSASAVDSSSVELTRCLFLTHSMADCTKKLVIFTYKVTFLYKLNDPAFGNNCHSKCCVKLTTGKSTSGLRVQEGRGLRDHRRQPPEVSEVSIEAMPDGQHVSDGRPQRGTEEGSISTNDQKERNCDDNTLRNKRRLSAVATTATTSTAATTTQTATTTLR